MYLYYKKYTNGLKSRTEVLAKMAGDRVAEMENKIASLKQRRLEIDQERNEARQNDQAHKEREKQLRPQMEELRKQRDAILRSNAKLQEMEKRNQTLQRGIQEFRKKAEEELKKDPAYSTLQENIETLQKAVNAMKQGSAEREKKQKQLQELQGQRNRMVQDRQWEYPPGPQNSGRIYMEAVKILTNCAIAFRERASGERQTENTRNWKNKSGINPIRSSFESKNRLMGKFRKWNSNSNC